MQYYRYITILFVILITFLNEISAQSSSISGRVYDVTTQESLVGATLVLIDKEAQQIGQVADEQGKYTFSDIAPGRYRLEISYVGYEKIIVPGFLIGSGPTTNLNFALSPGTDIITCEVVATAPAAVINPLKRSVSLEAVRRLPATFYDPARLLTLSPGVSPSNDQANHISVRGNSPDRNLWRLNGLAIVNPNHTANAGTLNDQPTYSGGGVNALSAQLLDNSTFYSGGLPIEYGNATGGTLDMRLRPGNTQRRQHQVQAGFIGFDLATEGPFAPNNPNSGSYLLNYRYSFTGLLADMGVDFGGEEIRFQDFSAHLFQPIGQNGKVSVFGLYGNSSNEFMGKDEELEEQKELYDIDFFSDLLIVGTNYEQRLTNGKLNFGVAYSATDTERNQILREFGSVFDYIETSIERTSGQLNYTYTGAQLLEVTAGVEYLNEVTSFGNPFGEVGYNQTVVSPYVNFRRRLGKWGLSAGVRSSIYTDLEASNVLEPRFNLAYYAGNSAVTLSVERNSRIPTEVFITETGALLNEDQIAATNQISLGWQSLDASKDRFSVNTYYQFTPDDYGIAAENTNSRFGLGNVIPFRETNTRSYGVELNYERPIRPEVLYYTANLSVFRSEYQDSNDEWQPGRFSRNFIFQGVVGKEWPGTNKRGKARAFGVNASIIIAGGERFGQVNEENSRILGFLTIYNTRDGLADQLPTYIRPDLRLYRRKYHRKTTTTLALDIQNVMGRENVAFRAFDSIQDGVVDQTQLGLIPVLSYRIEWR